MTVEIISLLIPAKAWEPAGINLVTPQGCHSIIISEFPDFSLTFYCFPDPFGRPILAIFIHRLFEDFAQIFELADLIFKEKSSTINIRKGMFLNINCLQFMFRNIPFLILFANYGN